MSDMKKYGWIKDEFYYRDHLYVASYAFVENKGFAVRKIDLRDECPKVYDQGNLGSCTANAIAAAIEFEKLKLNKDMMPSRLFIYYNERSMEGTVSHDWGAQIRDGIKSTVKLGVCSEDKWPYNISKFIDKPTDECYTEALNNQVLSYSRLDNNNINHLISCLNEGYPFVFGFNVYESFESNEVAKTGIVRMPKDFERSVGGHAVMGVGYDLDNKVFIVRNSWGDGWGQKGYFTMPFEYVTGKLSNDFWTIRLTE